MNYLIPTVIEQTHRGERGWDIFSPPAQGPHRLPRHARSTTTSRTSSSRSCCSSSPRSRRRTSCSTSTRPAVTSRRASRSTTRCSTCTATWRRSAWARRRRWARFLLAAGAKGKRYALPHSRVMIHQPLGGFQGQATDIEIHAQGDPEDARHAQRAVLASTPASRSTRSRTTPTATTSCRRRRRRSTASSTRC